MKESYREGVTNHPGPEPCEGGRKTALEALDRGICRLGIELRNRTNRDAHGVIAPQGNTAARASVSAQSRLMPTLVLSLFRCCDSSSVVVTPTRWENSALRVQLVAFQRQRKRPIFDLLRPTVLGGGVPNVDWLARTPGLRPSRHGRPLAA